MTVALDAVGPSSSGYYTSSSGDSVTWSHACGAGATILLVFATYASGDVNLFSNVTYAGEAMTLLGTISADNSTAGGIAAYYLNSPATGSNAVSLDTGSSYQVTGGSVSYSGSGGIGSPSTAAGSSTAPAISLSGTTSGNIVVGFAASGTSGAVLVLSGTLLVNAQGDGDSGADNSYAADIAAGGTATITFDVSSDYWGIIGVEVQAGATGPSIMTTSLPQAVEGATGGTTPYTWSISSGSLPGWASISSSAGVISGTPSGGNAVTDFTVECTDADSLTATQPLTLSVLAPGSLVAATPGLAIPGLTSPDYIPGSSPAPASSGQVQPRSTRPVARRYPARLSAQGTVALGANGSGMSADVDLTTASLSLAAPLVTPAAGAEITLTAPDIGLAAPGVSVTAAVSVALTAPGISLAAPVPAPQAGAVLSLTAPDLELAAPLTAPEASAAVSLTAPGISLAAPALSVQASGSAARHTDHPRSIRQRPRGWFGPGHGGIRGSGNPTTTALTAPGMTLAAPAVSIKAGAAVALTAPAVSLAAPVPAVTAGASVLLTAPDISLLAPLIEVISTAGAVLTTPAVALAAPAVIPKAGAAVSLITVTVALAAPAVSAGAAGGASLTAPGISLVAHGISITAGAAVALTAPDISLDAPSAEAVGGLTVSLTTPDLSLAAPAAGIEAAGTVALSAPDISLAAPALAPEKPGPPGHPQPQPTRQPRRASARVLWHGTLVRGSRPPGPENPCQPQATRLPRRRPARAFWRGRSVPALIQGAPDGRIARRAAARVLWHGQKGVPATFPRIQPLPTRLPRRQHARGVWHHTYVEPLQAGKPGAKRYPRRYPARGSWQRLLNRFASPPEREQPALRIPRRPPDRRGLWRRSYGPVHPGGAVQPRSTIVIPRRAHARVVWRFVIGAAHPKGTLQPRPTVAIPRRDHARAVWHGTPYATEILISVPVVIIFDVYAEITSVLVVSFNVGQVSQELQRIIAEAPWLTGYPGKIVLAEQPRTFMQGGI